MIKPQMVVKATNCVHVVSGGGCGDGKSFKFRSFWE